MSGGCGSRAGRNNCRETEGQEVKFEVEPEIDMKWRYAVNNGGGESARKLKYEQ